MTRLSTRPDLSFYHDIPRVSDFATLAHSDEFRTVPPTWFIAMTDVRSSTAAIAVGRYRDVNMIGAAAIVAVSNALNDTDFPYVFGGDGATCLVPAGSEAAVRAALLGLKALARTQFNMELRVGLIQVGKVLRDGVTVEVGKYELTAGRCVALFRGGGLIRAEELLKGQPERYELGDAADPGVNLQGLSCRWNSVPSRHGSIVALLVRSRMTNRSDIYQQVLARLGEILGGHIQNADPVNEPAMTYRSLGDCILNERRYHPSALSLEFLKRICGIVISVLAFKSGLALFDAHHYRKAMAMHSDYRKFDDMLRMVLDCSPKQLAEIQEYLGGLHERGLVFYGLHESDTSLMTCFVGTVADGGHIHFIDGGSGGYATASIQMKAQIKAAFDLA